MSERAEEGREQRLKGKVQSAWGSITDDDSKRAKGNRDQLIGIIKETTGEAEQDIERRQDDLDKDEENQR